MKLNKKGFTLVELLTVMVILITILLIAIPSITSSLSRSENKQLEAKKASIVSDVVINIKRSNFSNNSGKDYSSFKAGNCTLSIDKLLEIGYITETEATDKNGNTIEGCVGYIDGDGNGSVDEDLVFIEKSNCNVRCDMNAS